MGDESVCELLEVGLGMLARARLGEGLRNTAQSCVQAIVRAAFTRLKGLTPEGVERLIDARRPLDKKGKENGQPENGDNPSNGKVSGTTQEGGPIMQTSRVR